MPDWLAHVLFAYVLCSVLGTKFKLFTKPNTALVMVGALIRTRLLANEPVVAKLFFADGGVAGALGKLCLFGSIEQRGAEGKPNDN